ncbi:MAG: 3-hydroxyacyl-CoA dehydrogenase NAD-binding domain-containing protein [Candidatus Dadabacteria bacterium]
MNLICVCGAGTMGSGIAEVCASAGHKVILYDLDAGMLDKAKERINSDLQKQVTRNKITPETKEKVQQGLMYTTNENDCKADLVIEAIVEKEEVKVGLFSRLMDMNAADTIYVSNTSSLSISSISKHLKVPERVAGLHFFNPAPVMRLVEIVRGEHTSAVVIDVLKQFVQHLGKSSVVCTDSPGFIVNRVARPYYIESLRLAEAGLSFDQIDKVLEGAGFKLGPFKLMDLIGNDVNYAVSCSVYEQLGKPVRLKPSVIQKEKVKNGHLGQKTGEGYFKY